MGIATVEGNRLFGTQTQHTGDIGVVGGDAANSRENQGHLPGQEKHGHSLRNALIIGGLGTLGVAGSVSLTDTLYEKYPDLARLLDQNGLGPFFLENNLGCSPQPIDIPPPVQATEVAPNLGTLEPAAPTQEQPITTPTIVETRQVVTEPVVTEETIVGPTKSLEEITQEFKQSAEYQSGLNTYFETMKIPTDAANVTVETRIVNGVEEQYIVLTPDLSKLPQEMSIKYADLYKPTPLFVYETNEAGEGFWRPVAEKDMGELNNLQIANGYYWGGTRQERFVKDYAYGVFWQTWKKTQPTKNSPISFSYLNKQDIPFSHNNNIQTFTWGIWPQDLPQWVKDIDDPQELRMIVINYVTELAKFSKEVGVKSIVLLNEKDQYRNPDHLKKVLGDDYDILIFDTFNAIYPECELIYNDFENRSTSEGRYTHTKEIATKLKSHGLDAIGFQLHDPINDEEAAARDISAMLEETGLAGYGTELDDNIHANSSPNRLFDQALSYRRKMRAVVNGGVEGILLWGYTDDVNWFELQAGERENPYFSADADPMTREEDFSPKPARYTVLSTLWELASGSN